MAGLVNTIGKGLKRAFDTFTANDSDTKDYAPTSDDPDPQSSHNLSPTSQENHHRAKRTRTRLDTEAERVGSLNHLGEQPRTWALETHPGAHQGRIASPFAGQRQGQQLRTKPSADERRLLPGDYTPPRNSHRIPVPQDEWSAGDMNPRRKPGQSRGPKPINTLNRPGPGMAPLATTTSRGNNLDGYPAKRQKIQQETSQDFVDNLPDDEYYRRSIRNQPTSTLQRQPSVISVSSQSQDVLSHSQKHNGFRQHELEGVDRMLNARPKKGRKAKTGATQQSSSPTRGMAIDHVNIDEDEDEDDDVQILETIETPVNTARTDSAQKASRQARSNSPRVEVESGFSRKWDAGKQRRPQVIHAEIPVRVSTKTAPSSENIQQEPKRRGETFRRDRQEPEESLPPWQPASKLQENMQRQSNTADTGGRRTHLDGLSEDELSLENSLQKPVRRQKRPIIRRSASPNRITSTHFTTKKENVIIPLKALCMKAGHWINRNMSLVFFHEEKAIKFSYNGDWLPHGESPIRLTSKYAQIMYYSVEDLNAVVLTTAIDQLSGGRILLKFPAKNDLEKFLEVIKSIFPGVKKKPLNDQKLRNIYEASASQLKEADAANDPEIQAMQARQGTGSAGHAARERAMRTQQGDSIPSPAPQAPTPRLTRNMRSEFINQPAAKPEADYSLPPPISQITPVTLTRSSGRLQRNPVGQAAKPVEPEPERWTEIHGIPKWDNPLTYPPTGTNRTTIDAQDIERLDDGQMLNDNLISFCLRDMEENNPELKGKAHIFNTYFYSSLSTLSSKKKGFNYDAVRRWTRNTDLFSLPFIVVPINVNLHWFLVIICNLDKLQRKLKLDGLESADDEETESVPTSIVQEIAQSQSTVSNDIEIPESPQEGQDGEISQGVKRISLDASQEQEDELPPASKLKPVARRGKKQAPPPQKVDPNAPVLMLLDSLGGSHPQEIKNLKQYVVAEGLDKRGLEFEYSELKGLTARGLPQQTNLCDCGVYLIGYMEAFLRDPAGFTRKVMSRELDHNNDFADFDPSKKRAEIRDRIFALHAEQEAEKKKRKKEKARLAKLTSQSTGNITSAATPPPAKPVATFVNSRMVQSSPTKPPPKQMQPSSPPVPASSQQLPPMAEREDEMLFDNGEDNGYQGDEDLTASNMANLYQQSNIGLPMSFKDQLLQATEAAQHVEDE